MHRLYGVSPEAALVRGVDEERGEVCVVLGCTTAAEPGVEIGQRRADGALVTLPPGAAVLLKLLLLLVLILLLDACHWLATSRRRHR